MGAGSLSISVKFDNEPAPHCECFNPPQHILARLYMYKSNPTRAHVELLLKL